MYAQSIRIRSALGKCILYDTILQHKNGDDPDSFGAILAATQSQVGHRILTDSSEAKWLTAFLSTRMSVLISPHNKQTKEEWKDSAERVTAFLRLIREENFALEGPINIESMNFFDTIS